MRHTLNIDLETYSSLPLKGTQAVGTNRYVTAPDFDILLMAYSLDGGPVECIDYSKNAANDIQRVRYIYSLIDDPDCLKKAFNAPFERTCLKTMEFECDPSQWQCTMVKCSMLGLPMKLDTAAKVLGITEQKAAGEALINYFCKPCKPTKSNGGRTRNLPEHAPEKWAEFVEYNKQDVRTEQAVSDAIAYYEVLQSEHRLWELDQRINERGILIDRQFAINAIEIDKVNRMALLAEARELTGLENPNSNAQLMAWLNDELTFDVTTLAKAAIPDLILISNSDTTTRMLRIKQELAKSSIKKFYTMMRYIMGDDRARGLLQFFGAGPGRWAGRGIQMQNLPGISLSSEPDKNILDIARGIVAEGDGEELANVFGNVPDTLSQLIRTAFIAKPDHRFIVADFSSIEARMVAWLAGEKWRLEAFAANKDIYKVSAAAMNHIPFEAVTKDQRQQGKIAELSLGYQGGVNALKQSNQKELAKGKKGIPEDEMEGVKTNWRKASPCIVNLWYDLEAAAIRAVKQGETVTCKYLKFYVKHDTLFMQLPSGRALAYQRPRIEEGKFEKDSLTFEGINSETKKWCKQHTYGGALLENACQAIARDCLAYAMTELDRLGFDIVLHVHDEVVLEVPDGHSSLEEVCKIISTPIPWAKGLPLAADGFESKYYKK